MKSYPVKVNIFGSAVSEILRYKQTNKQTDIVLLCIIDFRFMLLGKSIYNVILAEETILFGNFSDFLVTLLDLQGGVLIVEIYK